MAYATGYTTYPFQGIKTVHFFFQISNKNYDIFITPGSGHAKSFIINELVWIANLFQGYIALFRPKKRIIEKL